MSHSPIKSPSPTHTAMVSELPPTNVPVGSPPCAIVEIKQEEPEIAPSTPLLIASQPTPITVIIDDAPTVSTTTPTLISNHTPTPTFTPIACTTTSTPIPTPPPTVPNIRKGRQGRPPKERTLVKNHPVEKVNYPCHEKTQLSEFHRQKLEELDVYPKDGVGNYTRSIPFKGAKESFLKRTGRNRFDVFEYRFTAPNVKGESKQWWVMWDYYNGLVRVHDFFDCCKPGKTEPGNAVKEKINPGLQNVCHNITGGNLHAQGYWIPFLAAKALATKFCFRIRFALTIIFGDDFPSQCLPPTHPDFGKYQISPDTIQSCQQISVQQFAIESQRATPAPQPPTPLDFSLRVSSTPSTGSLLVRGSRDERSEYQRVSVTPERTAANRYFDPVRGGYTNGSSSSGQRSQLVASRYSTARVRKVSKTDKAHKSPRGISGVGVNKSSSSSLKTTFRNEVEPVFRPTMGNFTPAQSSSVRRLPQLEVEGRRFEGGKMRQLGMGSGYLPRIGGGVAAALDVPADRLRSFTRKHSLSPPVNSEGPKRGANRRPDSRRASSSVEPIPHHPARDRFASPDSESHEEPITKRSKIVPSEPRVYTNPYMNPITFCVGTFTNPYRASRDSSIPEPVNPYTRSSYNQLVASQVEETSDDLLAVEAAGQLMELQRRDYEKEFAQREKELRSVLKRRRSN